MKTKMRKSLTAILALVLCIAFGAVLMVYIDPMEDVSLDLSMMGMGEGEAVSWEDYDDKGWTVYTQEGATVTALESNGLGGFTGLALGQTFYFSRVMEEELDSPTLQIGAANRTFSVWLDDTLIYTDCPELDNRIGYLTLPMNEWDRDEPIIISLPPDYQGKTLTIAQSFPEYSEVSSVRAYPAETILYCGYAYESGLISESFSVAIAAAAAFAVGVILLAAFVRNQDWGLVCLALVAFLGMVSQLTDASFFWKYFGNYNNSLFPGIQLISTGALLVFLATRGGKHKKILWGAIGALGLSIAIFAAVVFLYPVFGASDTLAFFLGEKLPYWVAFAGLVTALVLGAVFWRRENRFYRVFTPLALGGVAACWAVLVLFVERDTVAKQLAVTLQSGYINYIFFRTMPAVMAAALLTALVEIVKKEISRRMEKRLLEERRELALESYENMRRQHEEVMMLRHDMGRHFQTLREMSGEEPVRAYLDELIGQNRKIRPVVQSGNEMLDIILNSKLSSAMDNGIKVEVLKAQAPETLPLSNADLCSLVMNIMDNAITAAGSADAAEPFIRLSIYVKGNFLALACENTADIRGIEEERKKETVPKHGLGLKIIRSVAERYEGVVDTEYGADSYKVRVAIPLL